MSLNKRPIVGVMGSHENEWEDYADPVGDLLARRGFNLLTGAGAGVMTAAARGFTSVEDRKGVCIGIVPTIDYEGKHVARDQYPNPYIEIPILTPLDKKVQGDTNPYSRNYVNVMTSDAVIILPGEHGTMNEVSLTLRYNKPLILFGPDKAFEKFPQEPLRADSISYVAQFLDDVFGDKK